MVECNNFCTDGEYAKCNYNTNKCDVCQQLSDPKCIHTMDYC